MIIPFVGGGFIMFHLFCFVFVCFLDIYKLVYLTCRCSMMFTSVYCLKKGFSLAGKRL